MLLNILYYNVLLYLGIYVHGVHCTQHEGK